MNSTEMTIAASEVSSVKKCNYCRKELPEEEFHQKRNGETGKSCKKCHILQINAYKKYSNTEKGKKTRKQYIEKTREQKKKYDKEWRESNLERKRKTDREYYQTHKDKWLKRSEENKDKQRISHKISSKKDRESLTDAVVIASIWFTDESGSTRRLKTHEATPELIQAKREQLLLHRELQQFKKETKNARETKECG